MAQRVWRPMDSADHLEAVTRYALDFILQMVLQGENLLVWKALLERYEYDDMAVASFTGRSGVFIGLEVKGCCEPSASI